MKQIPVEESWVHLDKFVQIALRFFLNESSVNELIQGLQFRVSGLQNTKKSMTWTRVPHRAHMSVIHADGAQQHTTIMNEL